MRGVGLGRSAAVSGREGHSEGGWGSGWLGWCHATDTEWAVPGAWLARGSPDPGLAGMGLEPVRFMGKSKHYTHPYYTHGPHNK